MTNYLKKLEQNKRNLSGKLIQRFGSKTTMHVVLLVFAIRFLYYSNMISPWQTLGVEMLNGLTTGDATVTLL
jgi:hypothetical protein